MIAPLTPSTIALIRKQAESMNARDLAQTLGWDVEKLRRVCRGHGIELVAGNAPKGEEQDQ